MGHVNSIDAVQVSAAKRRTRKSILDAALTLMPSNPSVSLGEIAEAASVGRSTLHRHFADRAELVRALALYVRDLSNAAIDRADPESGDAIDALRRIVDGQFDLGPALVFIHDEPSIRFDYQFRQVFGSGDDKLVAALVRAASTNESTPVAWRHRVFWEVLRLGSEYSAMGAPRHEAISAIMRTLTAGIVRGASHDN